MINYWQPGYEWMGHGLQGHWCPSFAHYQLQSPDLSGLGNHGQLINFANNGNNALVTSGGKGALDFDAVDDRVATSVVTRSAAITVSFWTNFSYSGSDTFARFIEHGLNESITINLNKNNSPNSIVSQLGDGNLFLATTTSSWVGWNHILLSVSMAGTTATGTLFVNGGSESTGTKTYTASVSRRWFFGGGDPSVANITSLSGQLDDIRIYNRALTAQEILATYQADRGGGMGYQPPLRRSYAALLAALVLACDTGSYSLSGQSAGLFAARSLAADQAQYLLSGNAANTLASRLLSSDPATYAATGNDAATLCARLLDGGAAAYALTGIDAGLIANRKLTADQAICFLAGNNAELLRTLKLNAGSMPLQLDNFAASLLAGRTISADGAQYLLVVADANFTSSTGGAAPYYYLFMMRGPQ